jgi:chemotaxis protein methyltransferase CheR
MLALVEEVSLGETWFFRERHQFDYLRDAVFPQLLESNSQGSQGRRLRIWSAACSTGEEAYSLAIAYNQFKPSNLQTQVEVFATDVRNRALMDASKARYYEDSLRDVDPQTLGRYFERGEDLSGQSEESRLVIADIRKLVTFRRVNLLERVYWKGMSNRFDLIVCANLLVFFGHTAARQMVGNMAQSLRQGGYLMVAPNEGSLVVSPLLSQLKEHESFFQRTN